ncbi:MAG: endonuclease V [Candidatus Thermoplasmatota archaeon]|jgi:deoxyribonuclease V|nr:endonuclease V [Candidatus Thermoplasmatota archaeon]
MMYLKPAPGRSPKIEADGPIKELDELSRSVPEDPSDLEGYFTRHLFPLLNIGHWTSLMLEEVRESEVLTFGAAAAALGAPKGARGIAEWTALGKVKGPTYKLVRKVDLGPGKVPITPTLDLPPFSALARVQSSMEPLLRGGDGRERMAYLGLDISTLGNAQASAIVVVSPQGEADLELASLSEPTFPYIPGFLFYKEASHLMPLVKQALQKGVPDESVLVLDGNGTIHPRGIGIACQIGIALDMPSMGIAKRLLWGRAGPWERSDGGALVSRIEDEGRTIGHGLRGDKGRPLYASRGHRTGQDECIAFAIDVLQGRKRSPTKLAHIVANRARRLES